jgi:hypothetical protein
LILRITKRGSQRITSITQRQIDGVYTTGSPRSSAWTTCAATASGSPANGGGFRPAVIPVFTNPGLTHTVFSPWSRNLWSRPSR